MDVQDLLVGAFAAAESMRGNNPSFHHQRPYMNDSSEGTLAGPLSLYTFDAPHTIILLDLNK